MKRVRIRRFVGIAAIAVGGLTFFALLVVVGVAARLIHAPGRLAAEKQALLSEGCPVDPAQLQSPLPPAGQNAAPLYADLMARIKAHPLSAREESDISSAGDGENFQTRAFRQRLQQILRKHADLLRIIHSAASRPSCVFVRDWSQGPCLQMPEYAYMRSAARLLRAESYLMASSGRYHEAVANQALGFRLAEHAGADPYVIGYLVDLTIDRTSLKGMQQILSMARQRPDVDEAVYQAIAWQHPRIDLRAALKGEVALFGEAGYRMLAKAAARHHTDTPGGSRLVQMEVRALNGPGRHLLLDSMFAELFHDYRLLLGAAALPGRQRYEAMVRIGRAAENRCLAPPTQWDPTFLAAGILMPVYSEAAAKELNTHAEENETMALAKLLEHRSRSGSFPARLEQAIPHPPTDPWSDQPLHYRPEGDGFIIYSVGPTGHYNGGKPGIATPENETALRFP